MTAVSHCEESSREEGSAAESGDGADRGDGEAAVCEERHAADEEGGAERDAEVPSLPTIAAQAEGHRNAIVTEQVKWEEKGNEKGLEDYKIAQEATGGGEGLRISCSARQLHLKQRSVGMGAPKRSITRSPSFRITG